MLAPSRYSPDLVSRKSQILSPEKLVGIVRLIIPINQQPKKSLASSNYKVCHRSLAKRRLLDHPATISRCVHCNIAAMIPKNLEKCDQKDRIIERTATDRVDSNWIFVLFAPLSAVLNGTSMHPETLHRECVWR